MTVRMDIAGAGTRVPRDAAAPAPSDDARIDAAIERLATIPSGREIAELLRSRREDIVVLDNDDSKLPGGAGGRWDSTAGKLYLRRDQLDAKGFETLLAHEGEHMRSAGGLPATAWRSLKSIGTAVVDMAVAPFQLRNPVTAAIDGVRGAFQINEEASAYHVQAKVASELDLHADFLQHADHSPRSEQELQEWLLDNPLYALPPVARGGIGLGFGYMLGRASGQLTNAAITRLAPQSWLGRHPGVVTAAGLTIAAGLLVQDQVAARS